MTNNVLFPLLVADIGGTNARFGIVSGARDNSGRFIIDQASVYSCTQYDSFESVFNQYLQTLKSKPNSACIAVAGPIINNSIQMTNLDWSFSTDTLSKRFAINNIEIINDFGALAYATLYLQADEVDVLYAGNKHTINADSGARVVLGPGTGLGIAGLIKTPRCWQPVCGEGGHVSFAAVHDIEFELRKAILRNRPNKNHLSIEDLVSGPGLVTIYQALCHLNNVRTLALTPSQISSKAKEETDEQCVMALTLFSQFLGSIAGDIALTMGAFGGVYLSGGILPKISNTLNNELLINRYLDKGIKRSLLETIPIYLVTSEMPALVGAAHWMYDTSQYKSS